MNPREYVVYGLMAALSATAFWWGHRTWRTT
jgi:hypothetical protein